MCATTITKTVNTDKCLIVSLNVFSVCKEPSRDPSAAAPFRGVLSNVEGKKGKDRIEGCNKDQTRVGVNILGSRVDTRKLRFPFFVFLPCNPTLRSLHCLLGGCNRD